MLMAVEIIDAYFDRLAMNKFPMVEDELIAERLLNEALNEIAQRVLCTEHTHSVLVQEYTSESGTVTTHTSETVIASTSLSSTVNDYYNGWYYINQTVGITMPVRDYGGAGQQITLAAPITGSANGDSFKIEKRNNEVDLPKDYIEMKYVILGDRELQKIEERDIRRQEAMVNYKGKPTCYGLTNNKLILYGKPSANEQLTMHYYAQPRYAIIDEVAANGGAVNEIDLHTRFKSVYPTHRIIGSTVQILDGSHAGDEATIQHVVDDTNTLLCYVYPDFSGTLSQGDQFCTDIDLAYELHNIPLEYMLWNTYITRESFRELGVYHKGQFDEKISAAEGREFRKKMARHAGIGRKVRIGGYRGEFKGDIETS